MSEVKLVTPRARFPNSLHQRKPSFGIKTVLSQLLKMRSEELVLKSYRQLFLHPTLLNMDL